MHDENYWDMVAVVVRARLAYERLPDPKVEWNDLPQNTKFVLMKEAEDGAEIHLYPTEVERPEVQ